MRNENQGIMWPYQAPTRGNVRGMTFKNSRCGSTGSFAADFNSADFHSAYFRCIENILAISINIDNHRQISINIHEYRYHIFKLTWWNHAYTSKTYRKTSQKISKNIAKCLVFIAKYRKISIQAISIFCDTHLSQKNLQFRYLSLCLKNIDNVQKVSIMTKNYRKCTCNKRKTRASCMKNTSVIAIFFDNYRKFAIFIATIFSLR